MQKHDPCPGRRPAAALLLAALTAGLVAIPAAWAAPGDPDAGFGFQGQVLVDLGSGRHEARALGHLSDGRIVVAGAAGPPDSEDACAVAMLLPDGSLDPGFGDAGRVIIEVSQRRPNACEALLVQPDDRIVLVGHRGSGFIGNRDFMVIRLNTDGTPDISFNGDGFRFVNFALVAGSVDQAYAVALQPDGKLVVAGRAERGPDDFDLAVVRLNPDGTPDTSFSGDGRTTLGVDLAGPSVDEAWAVALQADGRIVLAGDTVAAGEAMMLIARLHATGLPDNSFGLSGYRRVGFGAIPNARARGLAIRADGTLLVGGYVHNDSTADFAALALLANGLNDASFGVAGQVTIDFPGVGGSTDAARAMAVDPLGRILLGGLSGSQDNVDFAAVRLLADGSPDPAFGVQGRVRIPFDLGPAPFLVDDAHALHLLPDGGVLLAGSSAISANDSDFSMVKLQGGLDGDQLFGDGFELIP